MMLTHTRPSQDFRFRRRFANLVGPRSTRLRPFGRQRYLPVKLMDAQMRDTQEGTYPLRVPSPTITQPNRYFRYVKQLERVVCEY
jgi:hypothetical protein